MNLFKKKRYTIYSKKEIGQIQLLFPVILLVSVFSILPLLRGIYLGFTDYRLGDPISFNGLDNYVQLFNDEYFWNSFKIGMIWTLVVTALQVSLGLGLALLLNNKIKFIAFYTVLILIPWATPPIIRGILWRQMYEPNTGAVNILLNDFGLINTPINWLTNFEYVIPAVIVAGVWGEISKAAIFLLAGLQTISNDLYEASKIDGAGLWAQFWHITLPVLKPVLAAIISLTFMWNFNTFGIIWVLTQGGPGGMTRLPMLAAYEEGFRYGYIGYAAAIGNVMVIILSVILFMYIRVQLRERKES
ncbi:MAG: sugar ABC transporter permease [Ignavibacteriota bacterium]|nr:sugar ABC transporter permease [Ignavibacteriota bacterium]MBW7842186.1 sugar ABC transporter permease [Ignavibacterium sp.]MCO6446162.1 sugar ABC transporter permease [Ignavibacterium album]MCZ2267503.1 sugar ABC transporter permease [Ignavibacteriales bacterium]HMN17294.1 sugar ABC transporter permease [Ignavibacteriaceae bacterium]